MNPFAYLHQRTLASFGSTSRFLWWPATEADARAGRYTVRIQMAAAPVRQDENPLMGAVSTPADALQIHATAADFPPGCPVRPDRVCLIGPDDGSGAPAATCERWRVNTASFQPDYHSHVELQLVRTK